MADGLKKSLDAMHSEIAAKALDCIHNRLPKKALSLNTIAKVALFLSRKHFPPPLLLFNVSVDYPFL